MEQHHEMVMKKIHPSGAEEWYCPTCGRRFLLQWPPAYEMIVLETGDPYARHSGVKGVLQAGPVQAPQSGAEPNDVSDRRLRPWLKAIENLDLNW